VRSVGFVNGDFESGSFSGWTLQYNTDTPVWKRGVSTSYAHSGNYGCQIGAYKNEGSYSAIVGYWQNVDLTDAVLLRFWYRPYNYPASSYRYHSLNIGNDIVFRNSTVYDGEWHCIEIDVTPHVGTYKVYFYCSACRGGAYADFDDFELLTESDVRPISRNKQAVSFGSASLMVV